MSNLTFQEIVSVLTFKETVIIFKETTSESAYRRDCSVERKPPFPWKRPSLGRKTAYPWPGFEEKTVPSKENRLSLPRDGPVEGKPPIPSKRLSRRRKTAFAIPSKENRLSKRLSKKPPIEETVEETPPNGGISSIGR
jgi:hypothetical protein